MTNKTFALVTGGAHRLGMEFVLWLASRGYPILLHYHSSREKAEQTAKKAKFFGVPVRLVQCDLSSDGGILSVIESIDKFSEELSMPIGILINSAANFPKLDLKNTTSKEWDEIFAVNLRAPFLLTQQVATRMTNGGIVVNISDIGAQKLWSQYSAYSISKAALESLTRLQAKTYAPSIRVNAIAPGFVIKPENFIPGEWERLLKKLPIQQPISPASIIKALEYLIQNCSITGQILVVDGGFSIG